MPGTACRDCGDCDLYADEDEAVAIRCAAKAAELEYWVKTGKSWRGDVVETRVLGRWAEWCDWAIDDVIDEAVVWM